MIERKKITTGVFWRLIEVIGAEVLAFSAFVILARLLLPEEFGTVALASLFVLTAQLLLYQGLGEAIIQGDEITDVHVSSAFWVNIGLGGLAAAILMLLSGPVSVALDEPAFGEVLRAIAPTLVLFGASGIFQAKLRRELQLRGFAMASVSATLIGGLVAISFAWSGWGVWSLVFQQWAYCITSVSAFAISSRWMPALAISKDHLQQIWRFGSLVIGAALLRFAMRRVDLLILGYFVSTVHVGYYFLANRLMFSAGMLTYYSIQQIGLPVLSRLVDDPFAFRNAIHNTLRLASLFCLPTLVGLGLISDVLIPLVFGPSWLGSITPFQILCGFSIFYALALMSGQILLSAGHAGWFLKLSTLNVALFLTMVTIAAPFGISAAAFAGGVANMIALPTYLAVLRSQVGISIKRFLKDQWPIWFATIAMSIVVMIIAHFFADQLTLFWMLMARILIGGGTFSLVLVLVSYDDVKEIYVSCAELLSR